MAIKKHTRRNHKRSVRTYKAKGGVFGLFAAKPPAIQDIEMGNVKRIRELVSAGAQVQYVVSNQPMSRRSPHRSPRSVRKTPRSAPKQSTVVPRP